MFFDEPVVDRAYMDLLVAIARKQRELFLFRFDWPRREPKSWPPRGLFGKDKKALARYEALVQELEQLKARTVSYRKKQGYPTGDFWWNLPWEQVENYLMCDLTEYTESGAWRFQRDYETERLEGDTVLILREQGHCSDFSSSSNTIYAKESIYSEAQQAQMVDDFSKRQKDRDFNRVLFSGDHMVYSNRTKTLYASESDYVFSMEHYMDKEDARRKYERSLYTEHITQELTVVSRSRHYECLFAVGAFRLKTDGALDMVQTLDFTDCGSRGQVPPDVAEEYEMKDAAVIMAAYLTDCGEVKSVPLNLFGRDVTAPAPDYAAAMRQAELYTCLAEKLSYTD